MKAYMGIDPGKKGAICMIYEDNTITFYDWEDNIVSKLVTIAANYYGVRCIIERQQSMPMTDNTGKVIRGAKSTMETGVGYGRYLGALEALAIPYETIRPRQWMDQLGIEKKLQPKDRKNRIAHIMQNKYPNAELHGPKGGLKDGRSDALAIADYLRKRDG